MSIIEEIFMFIMDFSQLRHEIVGWEEKGAITKKR